MVRILFGFSIHIYIPGPPERRFFFGGAGFWVENEKMGMTQLWCHIFVLWCCILVLWCCVFGLLALYFWLNLGLCCVFGLAFFFWARPKNMHRTRVQVYIDICGSEVPIASWYPSLRPQFFPTHTVSLRC